MKKQSRRLLYLIGLLTLFGCCSLILQFRSEPISLNLFEGPHDSELAVHGVITSAVEVDQSEISLAKVPGQKRNRKLAYVFYTTDKDYACSVLVNMHILRNRLNTKVSFVWLITETIPEELVQVGREQFGARIQTVETLNPPPNAVPWYRDVMTKFQAFKLFELDRLILLDSDTLVLKDLDHLFNLPTVDIAMPRANWISDTFLTSAMIVVEPSERLWKRIEERLSSLTEGEYDMDLLNREFLGEVLVLPGNYLALDSFFDNDGADVPKWSHYKGQPDRFELMWRNEVMVIHYSSLGPKPWWQSVESARRERPSATSYFLGFIEDWWDISRSICPDVPVEPDSLNFDEQVNNKASRRKAR